ncbi:carboxypeptidase regulatory-like domain-containing protein [candidate division WOR-3 bacterium]|nr:carboxypeptidase regulatory-like domain-containing protein [candidate division WOR-3 bacterium]
MKKILVVCVLFIFVGIYATQPSAITGMVFDGVTKAPLAGAAVHAVNVSMNPIGDEGKVLTDSVGRYLIADLDPGAYTLSVEDIEPLGYYPKSYPELVEIQVGDTVFIDIGLIKLDSVTGSISGEVRLLDYYSNGWEGKVTVFSLWGEILAEEEIQEEGTSEGLDCAQFLIDEVPFIPCYVMAEVRGYHPQYFDHAYRIEEAYSVCPSDPPQGDVDFDMERASDSTLPGKVSGLIRGTFGPLPYSSVYATKEGKLVDGRRTGDLGTYTLSLEPGVYNVFATRAGYETAGYAGTITVADEEVSDVDIILFPQGGIGIEEKPSTSPQVFSVHVTPNPFRNTVNISYYLVHPGEVLVKVYDASGSLVRELSSEYETAGKHHIFWDGIDSRGSQASAGVYFARVILDNAFTTKPLVLIP